MIKVLHLSLYDNRGGAAKAMMRLHNSLKNIENIESKVLVVFKNSNSQDVIEINNFFFRFYFKLFNQIKKIFFNSNKEFVSFNLISTKFIINELKNIDFDILNLHWVAGEMISMKEIININKKIVWTFHDMWPFLGINHYYKSYNNFFLNYLDNLCKSKKRNIFKKNLSIIFPSKWMKNNFNRHSSFKSFLSEVIHYPIDLKQWKENKTLLKSQFRFDKDKFYLLFSSNSGLKDTRKGLLQLREIICFLKDKKFSKKVEIIIIGSNKNYTDFIHGFKLNFIKRIENEKQLIYFYSNSDLLLLLSKQDNFPLVMQESLSCSTPVITFDDGGMPEIIKDNYNGFVIKNNSSRLFAEKIFKYLNYDLNHKIMFRENSRKSILDLCNDSLIGLKLYQFYRKVY